MECTISHSAKYFNSAVSNGRTNACLRPSIDASQGKWYAACDWLEALGLRSAADEFLSHPRPRRSLRMDPRQVPLLAIHTMRHRIVIAKF